MSLRAMRRPLSWSMRFALALSSIFAIGTLSAGGLSYLKQSHDLRDRLELELRGEATSLAQLAAEGDADEMQEQLAALGAAAGGSESLYGFRPADGGAPIGPLGGLEPFAGIRRLSVGRDAAPGRVAPRRYLAFGLAAPAGWIVVARDEAWIAEAGEVLVQTMVPALGTALLLSIGLALLTARRNGRRIARMETVLEAVGAGRLDRRIGDAAADDMGELARRVDLTLARLEAGVEAIRQVSTDVAHDLRAPLTRARMRLEPEVLDPGLPAATRAELGAAIIDLDGLAETFEAILRLARLQSGTVRITARPVDLAALAEEIHELNEAVAQDIGHQLLLSRPPGPMIVAGERELLAQLLANLVDNALRHVPPPGRIEIAVLPGDGGPVLRLRDNGPGIAAADRARVLERFVRLDASRSIAGTGLGLSLVDAIARLHGAGLVLDDAGPGLEVRLSFPPAG